jgi:hypothetical protein
MLRASAFKDKITNWLIDNSYCTKNGTNQLLDVKPTDSMSNVGTDRSSKGSGNSMGTRSEVGSMCSRASSRGMTFSVKATTKKAALEEEAKRLQQRQELQQQQLRIKQQNEELELVTKIAQAAAEERTYSEINACSSEIVESKQFRDQSHASPINAELMERPGEDHPTVDLRAINQLPNVPSPLIPRATNNRSNNNIEASRRQIDLTLDNGPVVTNEQLGTIGNQEHSTTVKPNDTSQKSDSLDMLTQQQHQAVALTLPAPHISW